MKWTDKEVDNFKNKLSHQIDLITQKPFMFPASISNPRLRRAVMSKQTTVFYEVNDNVVYLAYLHINKRDLDRIK